MGTLSGLSSCMAPAIRARHRSRMASCATVNAIVESYCPTATTPPAVVAESDDEETALLAMLPWELLNED